MEEARKRPEKIREQAGSWQNEREYRVTVSLSKEVYIIATSEEDAIRKALADDLGTDETAVLKVEAELDRTTG